MICICEIYFQTSPYGLLALSVLNEYPMFWRLYLSPLSRTVVMDDAVVH
jgi:hypothetical protein